MIADIIKRVFRNAGIEAIRRAIAENLLRAEADRQEAAFMSPHRDNRKSEIMPQPPPKASP